MKVDARSRRCRTLSHHIITIEDSSNEIVPENVKYLHIYLCRSQMLAFPRLSYGKKIIKTPATRNKLALT